MSYIIKRTGGGDGVAPLNQGLIEVVLEDDNLNTRRFNTLNMAKDYLRQHHVTKFAGMVEFVEVVNMPEGFLSRIEWSSDGPSWAREDRKRINAIIKKALIDEAVAYRDLYDDCGELNSTKLAETFCNENELNVYDETGEPHTPCDLFEIAQEIEKEVVKEWSFKDAEKADSEYYDENGEEY